MKKHVGSTLPKVDEARWMIVAIPIAAILVQSTLPKVDEDRMIAAIPIAVLDKKIGK